MTDGRRKEQEVGKDRNWREYSEESETEVEIPSREIQIKGGKEGEKDKRKNTEK